jgi:hypothetical protein
MKRILSGVALVAMLSIGLTAAESPVADAAARGDRETVKSLLKQAADVNAAQGDGMTALHWAAMNGDAELAQMLIFAGANVRATTRRGTPCQRMPLPHNGYCPSHQHLAETEDAEALELAA